MYLGKRRREQMKKVHGEGGGGEAGVRKELSKLETRGKMGRGGGGQSSNV